MRERRSEFVHLLLADALLLERVDLILDLGDLPCQLRVQLFPGDSNHFHRVRRVTVLEDHRLLNLLIVLFEFVEMRPVLIEARLHRLELLLVLFQGAHHLYGQLLELLVLPFDPRADDVGLLGELETEPFVLLLFTIFSLQVLIALRHQSLNFVPFRGDLVRRDVRVRVMREFEIVVVACLSSTINESDDVLVLAVRIVQGDFELIVRFDQAADFVERVDEEHVHEILARAVEPVRIRGGLLGVVQEETVDLFDEPFGFGQGGTSLVR